MSRKVAIYVRTERQGAAAEESLREQEESCRVQADRMGWEVARVYKDVGIDARPDRRPQYHQMWKDQDAGDFAGIVQQDALQKQK